LNKSDQTKKIKTGMKLPTKPEKILSNCIAQVVGLVGWLEFNVPFQHKCGYIRDEGGGALKLLNFLKFRFEVHTPPIHR